MWIQGSSIPDTRSFLHLRWRILEIACMFSPSELVVPLLQLSAAHAPARGLVAFSIVVLTFCQASTSRTVPPATFNAPPSPIPVNSKFISLKPCLAYARECAAGVGVSLGEPQADHLPPILNPCRILLNSALFVYLLREEVVAEVGIGLIRLGTSACPLGLTPIMPASISPAASTILPFWLQSSLTFGMPPLNRLLRTRCALPRWLLWSP